METSSSPRLAVSGLIQQLKSGEISKMQLFQQLAKLQAGSSALPFAPPAPLTVNASLTSMLSNDKFSESSSNMGYGTHSVVGTRASNVPASFPIPYQLNQTPVATTPFSFGSAVGPFPFPNVLIPDCTKASHSFGMNHAPHSAVSQSKAGGILVKSDAEIFATGVSHEKVKQFSVQEWMSSKSKIPASNNVLIQRDQSHSQVANKGVKVSDTCHKLSVDNCGEEVPGISADAGSSLDLLSTTSKLLDFRRAGANTNGTVESWPNQGLTSSANIPEKKPLFENSSANDGKAGQHYLDFTEQFKDERDGDRISNCSSNDGGKGGNRSVIDDQFHARVTRWRSQKDAIREQMKQQQLQLELDECTFAPKVNPKSTKVVAKLREQQVSNILTEGLTASQIVSERLYQEADIYKTREELALKLKADKEAEIDRHCTFKPRINPGERVKAKYMTAQASRSPSLTAASREAAAKELAECTFNPKVNEIRSEMVSAQLYLQQNIYKRLSKPWVSEGEDQKLSVGGRSETRRSLSFIGDDENEDWRNSDAYSLPSCQDDISLRLGGNSRRRLSLRTDEEYHGPRSVDAKQSQEMREERARQFKQFIERQKFFEQARHKRIEQTKQQLTPGYKPNINKNSRAMMGKGRKGTFLQRVSTYARRKEHGNLKTKFVQSSDPNCTFKPAINQASIKRKPRSIIELSRGDLLRRETAQRLMKLKMEQEEMASLTFRPQLNRTSERYEGRLKITSSPETYLQRVKEQTQERSIKQRRAIQQKEIGEFNECTFKPRTIEAPAYVQRIARSVSLTKAFRAQHEALARAKEKPEWK
ncbi:hypothetical protein Plhal703r1_c29g0117321 [Plasmopara halstedii]